VEERATNVEERLARVLPFVREAPWEDVDLSIQTGGEPRGRVSRLRPLEAVREAGMQEQLLALRRRSIPWALLSCGCCWTECSPSNLPTDLALVRERA
jgi:heterodisulfide reductase subunit C